MKLFSFGLAGALAKVEDAKEWLKKRKIFLILIWPIQLELPVAEENPHADWHNGPHGDIILTEWQEQKLKGLGIDTSTYKVDHTVVQQKGLKAEGTFNKWNELNVEGKIIVPYFLDDTVTESLRQIIHDELADFSYSLGCIEMVYDPALTHDHGVYVFGETSSGDGCWSYVGECPNCGRTDYPEMQDGWQALRLPDWCIDGAGGVHHEFLHAMGLLHEQDRPDFEEHFEVNSEGGSMTEEGWFNTGHVLEPSSNLMYSGFTLKNGLSYSSHDLLTTTDAIQVWKQYCEVNYSQFSLPAMATCPSPDVVDAIRPVFEHRFCDGFNNCLGREDEGSEIVRCEADLNSDGCCASVRISLFNHDCAENGIVNGKISYACENGHELRWEDGYGWLYANCNFEVANCVNNADESGFECECKDEFPNCNTATTSTQAPTTTTEPTCNLIQEGSGTVTSPRFPNNYGDNEDCTYTLNADAGKTIRITFDSFTVEDCSSCDCDALTILENRYCGENFGSGTNGGPPTRTIDIDQESTVLTWTTDGSVTQTGFNFTWESVGDTTTTTDAPTTTESPSCDVIQEGSGTMTSPGFPNYYRNSENCTYTLNAIPGQVIVITFDNFTVESTSSCSYDALMILGQKYCGNIDESGSYAPPRTMNLYFESVEIFWTTDSSVVFTGWSFTWESSDTEFDPRTSVITQGLQGCTRNQNYPAEITQTIKKEQATKKFDQEEPVRIIGGVSAEANQWPWIARLRMMDSSGNAGRCGGTVVDNNWVLSAAHCCDGAQDIYATFSDLSSSNTNEANEYTIQADRYVVHPAYAGSGYDLCLIHFNEDIIAADNDGDVEMACVSETLPDHGSACWIAGWGTTESGFLSDDLLQAGVNIMDQEYCIANTGYDSLEEDDICAGIPDLNNDGNTDGGVDSCQGDSGGPLICDFNGKATLVGAVSRGYGCAYEGWPGLYSALSTSYDWIQETVKDSHQVECDVIQEGSGTVTSPGFPNNYENYENCTYTLIADEGKTIRITFDSFTVEDCSSCSCDALTILENRYCGEDFGNGTIGSPPSRTIDIDQESAVLTWTTDYSVTRPGFNFTWESVGPEGCEATINDSTVSCNRGNMIIEVPVCALEENNINPNGVYMDTENCRGQVVGENLVFDAGAEGCMVEPNRSNDLYVYNATILSGAESSMISRHAGLELKFSCVLERRQTVSLESGVNVNVNYIFVDFGFELGAFEIEMTVYNSSAFLVPATVEHVFHVPEKVYIGVSNKDSQLSAAFERCVAFPEDDPSLEYTLIENACSVDPATAILSSGSSPDATFEFEAFQFSHSMAPISIECEISICEAEDCNVCQSGRRRRRAANQNRIEKIKATILAQN
ncbi:unnamed protein product [Oikopleura dioica]|uniref:Oikosin 24g n=1 Tax=Oikopleura dioica TaxID=34765 RepID=E4XR50_OIKDI|nr:unnamed protein product [Oikopleura dioica]CCG47863.1 oikosin 24g [Oikopleura dioica]